MNKEELHLSKDRKEFENHLNSDDQKMRQKQVAN